MFGRLADTAIAFAAGMVAVAALMKASAIVTVFFDRLLGVLCLFLLYMGLKMGDGLLRDRRVLSFGSLAFGCIMPVIGAFHSCLASDLPA